MVHNTGFGYLCPSDTPEGEPVGLLKNLSIMAHVSVESDLRPVYEMLEELEFNDSRDLEALHRYCQFSRN